MNASKGRRADLQGSRREQPESPGDRAFGVTRYRISSARSGPGEFLAGWATADGASLVEGVEAMRRGVESVRGQNAVAFDGIIKIALAEAEVRVGDPERALAVLATHAGAIEGMDDARSRVLLARCPDRG